MIIKNRSNRNFDKILIDVCKTDDPDLQEVFQLFQELFSPLNG